MIDIAYTTAANIAGLLNLRSGASRLSFDGTTFPTLTEVNTFIDEADEYIDRHTNNSWKSTNVVSNEQHNYDGRLNKYGAFIITLHKGPIQDLSSASGDKLEIYRNNAWEDILTTKTKGAAPYEDDFFVDTEFGHIYLHTTFPNYGRNQIRVTYRYGNSSVPKDIQEASTKLAAIKVLSALGEEVIKTEVPSQPSWMNLIEKWQEDVENILSYHNRLHYSAFFL